MEPHEEPIFSTLSRYGVPLDNVPITFRRFLCQSSTLLPLNRLTFLLHAFTTCAELLLLILLPLLRLLLLL